MLADLGVPTWAQVTGDEDPNRLRLFAWVEEDLTLRSVLVGRRDPSSLEVLAARCREILAGTHRRPPADPPEDLDQPAALALVHQHGVGHGSLSRPSTRPYAELLEFALREIEEHIVQEPEET